VELVVEVAQVRELVLVVDLDLEELLTQLLLLVVRELLDKEQMGVLTLATGEQAVVAEQALLDLMGQVVMLELEELD
jgi:hypothetical protein